MRKDNDASLSNSPRQENNDPRSHTLYQNPSSKLLAQTDTDFMETGGIKNINPLAGYEEGRPLNQHPSNSELLPQSNHFLPETIKGVDTSMRQNH